MAAYKVLYWQEIPTQIKAEDDEDDVTVMLDGKFMQQVDILAAKRGLQSADDYLAQWKWSEEEQREGSAQGSGGGSEGGAGSKGLAGPLARMAVHLIINGQSVEAVAGVSLFDQAEALGIEVPTSCRKQGKCKECMVEVVEGRELLSPMTEAEQHLKEKFRLSCQTYVTGASGQVRCHTMRRGHMRIERHAFGLPGSDGPIELDPAVTRDGERILIDGVEVDRCGGPIHGLAMDLGTTTVVVRLLDLETGELIADTSFENPQRFGGAEVMSRIAYDTDHPGRLLMRTLAGYLTPRD